MRTPQEGRVSPNREREGAPRRDWSLLQLFFGSAGSAWLITRLIEG